MILDFRNFRGVGLRHLIHSAKGSTWNEHKYIKRIDGTYYYPDDYEGGRHLQSESSDPSNKKEDNEKKKSSDSNLEDWEKILYKEIADQLDRNPGLFDPRDITDDDWQDFGLTLAEFAGIDTDELSKSELERMRAKVADYYSARTLSKDDIEKLAQEVIRGNFGNGDVRKEALGMNYQEVQDRVNEILKGSTASTKVLSLPKEEIKKAEESVETIVAAVSNSPSLDFEKIFRVYRK